MSETSEKLIESLSPLEIKIIPHLKSSVEEIQKLSDLDRTSILRALKLLEAKNVLSINTIKIKTIDLGTNGIYYKKNHLPERTLITLLENNNRISLEDAKKQSKLSDNEFKVSLGVLKSKALIDIKEGKLILSGNREEISKKSLEELFLETLPRPYDKLEAEEQFALKNLQKRKEIVEITEKSQVSFSLTPLGETLAGQKITSDLIEEVTPKLIKNWKKRGKFRKYDLSLPTPKIYGGKKHFVNQTIEYAKRIWLDLGFKEMEGNLVQTSFWNFDALFTAQDHPVREMQDTFYIKDLKGKLPEKSLVTKVKQAHEKGVDNSKGWQYSWSEEEAKSVVLRTHTTCLSAQTLASLDIKKDLPAKYFTIGKNFRNETVDWSHGFEFNQTEGIVIDKDANLRNLIGYLKIFASKMGFEKLRIQPAYFPYTEPSLEGAIWNEEKQTWVEVLAAGIFRPEVTEPLLGSPIPVLAWGPGFDRLMMMAHKIKDMREVYNNDLKDLREKRFWLK